MDLTRSILYRDFVLNDENILDNLSAVGSGEDQGIVGCVVDSVNTSDVDVVQFLEKRSQQDGMDAGDPFLGARRVRMAGTLYATNRSKLFDAWQELKAACSATLAHRESPADKGYLPLYYSVPTNRTDEYPDGVINLMVRVLPRVIDGTFDRDRQGGDDADALAIPWQATFLMRDPRILSATPWDHEFTAMTEVSCTGEADTDVITSSTHGLSDGDRLYFTALAGGTGLVVGTAYYVVNSTASTFKVSLTSGGAAVDFTDDITDGTYVAAPTDAGDLQNRGDYHAPLNALFVVGAQAGTITLALGGSVFTITVPESTGDRTIRYKGEDKVLTVEEGGLEGLRMDLLTFQSQTAHPLVPGGDSPYTATFTGVLVKDGSHMWFWESFA